MVLSNNKKRAKLGKYVLIISSIAALNLAGVSYAYWEQGNTIRTSASTGYINPVFDKTSYSIVDTKGEGKLDISFQDDYTMIITGEVSPGFSAEINFNIANTGTIPIRFTPDPGLAASPQTEGVNADIKFSGQEIGSGKQPAENSNLHIEVGNIPEASRPAPPDNKDGEGNPAEENGLFYIFELSMPFEQYVNHYSNN